MMRLTSCYERKVIGKTESKNLEDKITRLVLTIKVHSHKHIKFNSLMVGKKYGCMEKSRYDP